MVRALACKGRGLGGECLVAATREFFLSPKQRLCACASSSQGCEGDFVRMREQEHLDYQWCKTDQFHRT